MTQSKVEIIARATKDRQLINANTTALKENSVEKIKSRGQISEVTLLETCQKTVYDI